jgi:hypothetical protein
MKRNVKLHWKLLLDLVLALTLVLLYNKRGLGMAFHEIAGLAICGLFVVHKLLNWAWIKAVTKGLFSKHTPARQKLYWILDFSLFASFAAVLVTGILISKVVFPGGQAGNNVKILHYGAAALALAFTGIHVGLHARLVFHRFKALGKLPIFIRRGLAVALSVAMIGLGAWQATDTAFLNWIGNLSNIVTTSSAQLAQSGTGTETQTSNGLLQEALTDTQENGGNGNGNGGGNGLGMKDGLGPHGSGEGAQNATTNWLTEALVFLSILLGLAVAVAWVDAGFATLKRKRRKTAVSPGEAMA